MDVWYYLFLFSATEQEQQVDENIAITQSGQEQLLHVDRQSEVWNHEIRIQQTNAYRETIHRESNGETSHERGCRPDWPPFTSRQPDNADWSCYATRR